MSASSFNDARHQLRQLSVVLGNSRHRGESEEPVSTAYVGRAVDRSERSSARCAFTQAGHA